jgi:carboxymethylenebutenolidase
MKSASRTLVMIAVLGLLAAGVLGAQADGPRTETVQFPSSDGTASGFLALPAKPGRYPALITIHEWWGLTDWVKEQTEKLARQGYIALAVDLYRGKVTDDPQQANELMMGLPQDRAINDLQAAYLYLAARKDVNRDYIGAIGWAMGGGLALRFAMHEPRLSSCVVNYGDLPTDPNDILQIYAPVLGNFGADDRGVTPADVREFQKASQGMNHRIDVKIYDGAGHAFENSTDAAAYRPEAAADAWARTLAFLNKTMK